MAGKYGIGILSDSSTGGRSYQEQDGDFDEEDVWSVVKTTTSPKQRKYSGSRMIPKGNTSSSSSSVHGVPVRQASSPVNIPNWSSMRNKNMQKTSEHDDNTDDENEDDASEDGGEDGKVPPHEWIAKKLSRSQISSSSVHEGIGRTLKGRDLRKVRDDILSKTGFLE